MPDSFCVVTDYFCNITCTYCFNETHSESAVFLASKSDTLKRPAQRWTEPVITAAAKSISGLKFRRVVLTGGEPLVFPHSMLWMRAALQEGLQLGVITNATVLRDRHLELLAPHRERVFFSVSIGGLDRDSHDKYRERWPATLAGIEALVGSGFDIELSLVLTRSLITRMGEYEEFASRYRAVPHVAALSPEGAGASMAGDTLDLVTAEEWDKAIASVEQETLSRDLRLLRSFYRHQLRVGRCGMRTRTHVLLPDGDVVGCFHRSDINFGSIFQSPLEELLSEVDLEERGSAPCFGEHCLTLQYT
jgi:MoaA/NifB/PqqE/SkfB family radical SAM enzyme